MAVRSADLDPVELTAHAEGVQERRQRAARPGQPHCARLFGRREETNLVAGLAIAERREAIPALGLPNTQHEIVLSVAVDVHVGELFRPACAFVYKEIAAARD